MASQFLVSEAAMIADPPGVIVSAIGLIFDFSTLLANLTGGYAIPLSAPGNEQL